MIENVKQFLSIDNSNDFEINHSVSEKTKKNITFLKDFNEPKSSFSSLTREFAPVRNTESLFD